MRGGTAVEAEAAMFERACCGAAGSARSNVRENSSDLLSFMSVSP